MHRLIFIMVIFILSGCEIVIRTNIDPDHYLETKTRGVKANTEVLCLRPSAIKGLTNSEIPDNAPDQSCYNVVILSAQSSSIARAVSEYVKAERELLEQAAPENLPDDSDAQNSTVPTSDAALSTLVEVVESGSPTEAANKVMKFQSTMTGPQKAAISQYLETSARTTNNRSAKINLDAAARALSGN